MKKILLLLLLCPCLTVSAQTDKSAIVQEQKDARISSAEREQTRLTVKSEVLQDIRQTGGTYYAYTPPVTPMTEPPAGYAPFYVSHYGRHGSRYMLSYKYYERALRYLSKADSMGILTDFGKEVLSRVKVASIDAVQRDGDLTRLGGEQHQGISARMYARCTDAFGAGAHVHAVSSTSQRCIVSMANFCMSLKALSPSTDIFMETSQRYMPWIIADRKQIPTVRQDTLYEKQASEFESQLYSADRLMSTLFANKGSHLHHSQQRQLMRALFNITTDLQGLPELGVTLWDVFTGDELFALWQMDNIGWCRSEGLLPGCAPRYKVHYPLVREMISKADSVINCGADGADLRFGHDATIVPLAFIMQLDECRDIPSDLSELYKHFCSYKVTPMGANIQLVFYRNTANDILVKILHNERESSVPLSTAHFPYYRWTDLRQYLEERMKN